MEAVYIRWTIDRTYNSSLTYMQAQTCLSTAASKPRFFPGKLQNILPMPMMAASGQTTEPYKIVEGVSGLQRVYEIRLNLGQVVTILPWRTADYQSKMPLPDALLKIMKHQFCAFSSIVTVYTEHIQYPWFKMPSMVFAQGLATLLQFLTAAQFIFSHLGYISVNQGCFGMSDKYRPLFWINSNPFQNLPHCPQFTIQKQAVYALVKSVLLKVQGGQQLKEEYFSNLNLTFHEATLISKTLIRQGLGNLALSPSPGMFFTELELDSHPQGFVKPIRVVSSPRKTISQNKDKIIKLIHQQFGDIQSNNQKFKIASNQRPNISQDRTSYKVFDPFQKRSGKPPLSYMQNKFKYSNRPKLQHSNELESFRSMPRPQSGPKWHPGRNKSRKISQANRQSNQIKGTGEAQHQPTLFSTPMTSYDFIPQISKANKTQSSLPSEQGILKNKESVSTECRSDAKNSKITSLCRNSFTGSFKSGSSTSLEKFKLTKNYSAEKGQSFESSDLKNSFGGRPSIMKEICMETVRSEAHVSPRLDMLERFKSIPNNRPLRLTESKHFGMPMVLDCKESFQEGEDIYAPELNAGNLCLLGHMGRSVAKSIITSSPTQI